MIKLLCVIGFLLLSLKAVGQINLTQGESVGVGANGVLLSRPNEFHSADFTSPTLNSLLSTCPSTPTPCIWDVEPSATQITVPTTATIGSATQPVTVDSGLSFLLTGTGGDGIDIAQWGALKCRGNKGPASPSVAGCEIQQANTSILNSLVSNADQGAVPPQSDFMLEGYAAIGSAAGTTCGAGCVAPRLSCGVLCIIAVEGKGVIRDSAFGPAVGEVGMNFQDAGSGSSADNNALLIENVESFCSLYVHCLPLNIWGATGTGTGNGSNYLFSASSFVDTGSSNPNGITSFASGQCLDTQDCLVNLDGQSGSGMGNNVIGSITFDTTYFESSTSMSTTGSFMEANNVRGLALNNVRFDGGAVLTNCLTISGTSFGASWVTGRVSANKCGTNINNEITGYSQSNSSGGDLMYYYPGTNSAGFVIDGKEILNGSLTISNAAGTSQTALSVSASGGTLDLGSTNATVSSAGALKATSFTATNLLCSTTAPTISSGFGSAPSITNNGNCSFSINVGSGTITNPGVLTFPAAAHGWHVHCDDITTTSATNFITKQTGAVSTTSVTLTTFTTAALTTGTWTASDILECSAVAN